MNCNQPGNSGVYVQQTQKNQTEIGKALLFNWGIHLVNQQFLSKILLKKCKFNTDYFLFLFQYNKNHFEGSQTASAASHPIVPKEDKENTVIIIGLGSMSFVYKNNEPNNYIITTLTFHFFFLSCSYHLKVGR